MWAINGKTYVYSLSRIPWLFVTVHDLYLVLYSNNNRSQGSKTFLVLNSAEHEIFSADKCEKCQQ